MKVKEIIKFGEKSKIKAGDAVENGKYVFFTSSENEDKKYNEYSIDGENIIMGTGGNATLHYYNGKCAVSTDCLTIKCNDDVRTRYLYYFFKKNINVLQDGFKGAGLKHTNKEYIGNIEIKNIHLLNEQDNIVYILDTLSEIMKLYESQLKSFDDLVKSRFVEMFGDIKNNDKNFDVKRLEDICNGIGDGLHGTPEYINNDTKYPFINGNNLHDGKIIINSSTKYVSKETYEKNLIEMDSNTILISINGTLGKIAFYNNETLMLGKSACYCNLKKGINKVFVYYLMKSDRFLEYMEENATASTIKNVGLKAMRDYRIISPSTELQNNFATFVDQVDKSKFVAIKLYVC